jgi:hypothetical protein
MSKMKNSKNQITKKCAICMTKTNSSYEQNRKNQSKLSSLKKGLLIFVGTVSLGVGCIGIFLPILPTTPFLLLSAACYYKSSERLHRWLVNHKVFGKFIKNYMEGKGITARAKICAIALLWGSIGFAAFFAVPVLIVQVILFLIAAGVTMHILRLPTYKSG